MQKMGPTSRSLYSKGAKVPMVSTSTPPDKNTARGSKTYDRYLLGGLEHELLISTDCQLDPRGGIVSARIKSHFVCI